MDQEAEVMQIWKKDGQEQKWEESPVILLQKANVFQMTIVPSPANGPPFGVTMAHGEL